MSNVKPGHNETKTFLDSQFDFEIDNFEYSFNYNSC